MHVIYTHTLCVIVKGIPIITDKPHIYIMPWEPSASVPLGTLGMRVTITNKLLGPHYNWLLTLAPHPGTGEGISPG